jgi:hypothetical protein
LLVGQAAQNDGGAERQLGVPEESERRCVCSTRRVRRRITVREPDDPTFDLTGLPREPHVHLVWRWMLVDAAFNHGFDDADTPILKPNDVAGHEDLTPIEVRIL